MPTSARLIPIKIGFFDKLRDVRWASLLKMLNYYLKLFVILRPLVMTKPDLLPYETRVLLPDEP